MKLFELLLVTGCLVVLSVGTARAELKLKIKNSSSTLTVNGNTSTHTGGEIEFTAENKADLKVAKKELSAFHSRETGRWQADVKTQQKLLKLQPTPAPVVAPVVVQQQCCPQQQQCNQPCPQPVPYCHGCRAPYCSGYRYGYSRGFLTPYYGR